MEYSTEIFYKIVLIAALIWFIPVPVFNFKQKRIDAILEDRIKHKKMTNQEKRDYVNFNDIYKQLEMEKDIIINLDHMYSLKDINHKIFAIIEKEEQHTILYPAYVDGIQVQSYEKYESSHMLFLFKKGIYLYKYKVISFNKIQYLGKEINQDGTESLFKEAIFFKAPF